MAQPRVFQFFPVELGAEGRAVVQVGTKPTDVLVAEKSLGRGSVVLFTSTADRKWTDMVAHPSYPIWLNDTISQLGRRSFERPLRVGESLVLPLPLPINAVAPENVTCVEPGDRQRKVKTARRDGQIVADIGTVDRAGFYDVRYAKDAGLPLAVNVDAAESDVRCLEDRAIDESLRGTKVTIVPRSGDLTAAIRQGRIGREFWWELLLLAIVLLLVEAYLASRFTERIVADPGQARPVWGGALFGSAKTGNRGQAYNA